MDSLFDIDFVDKFLEDRKYLRKKYPKWNDVKTDFSSGVPIIEFSNTELLAGFTGYLKFQLNGRAKVYFRGEKQLHNTTVPSLFRKLGKSEITNERIQLRKKAFDKLIEVLPRIYKADRFKHANRAALLQHYGIRTDWIDLVDNLFVALWFASFDSNHQHSYIKYFVDNNGENKLKVWDLRDSTSSLSLRLHCQHGISATKQLANWDKSNIDFSDHLLAIGRIKNNKFNLAGDLFSKNYMFPNCKLDNTLKYLKKSKFRNKLEEILNEFNLKPEELGFIE